MDSYEKAKDLEINEIIPDSNDMACTYIQDVTYVTRDGLDLHLQIIRPDQYVSGGKKDPLIVFVQASAWYKQNCYMECTPAVPICSEGLCNCYPRVP